MTAAPPRSNTHLEAHGPGRIKRNIVNSTTLRLEHLSISHQCDSQLSRSIRSQNPRFKGLPPYAGLMDGQPAIVAMISQDNHQRFRAWGEALTTRVRISQDFEGSRSQLQLPLFKSAITKDTTQTHCSPARPSLVKRPDRSIRVLEGFVDGKHVQAKPDTGAQANFMSLSFAESLGLALDQEDLKSRIGFPMANGRKIWSVAQVSARWRFKNAVSEAYELKFFVLEKFIYDVVIGDDFLQSTQTMSVYEHRLSWAPTRVDVGHTPSQSSW